MARASLQAFLLAIGFDGLARAYPNFTYHLALSEPQPDDNWSASTGLIHEVLHREYLSKHSDTAAVEYYLCGPPGMVQAAKKMLEELECTQPNRWPLTNFKMPKNLNDGSNNPPRLKVYLNLGTLVDLPANSRWPRLEGAEAMAFLKQEGFEGAQDGNPEHCRKAGIGSAASARVDVVADAETVARKFKDAGHEAVTLHVGNWI